MTTLTILVTRLFYRVLGIPECLANAPTPATPIS
jgi:hypothetical protein